jgi:hypothetical protein
LHIGVVLINKLFYSKNGNINELHANNNIQDTDIEMDVELD